MKYVEMAYGSVTNRNTIIPSSDMIKLIKKANFEKTELYFSTFLYDESILEHFKKYKTIRSYKSTIYPPQYIPLDLDKGSNTDEYALEKVKEFVKKLTMQLDLEYYEYAIYYSGRGYHIYIPNYFKFQPSPTLHNEVKFTIKEHFPECDLAIYNISSIIRAPYSLNAKTNRYKVNLPTNEFMHLNFNDIKQISEDDSNKEIILPELEIDDKKDFSNLIIKIPVDREITNSYKYEPTRIVTCMQHLYNRGAIEGHRHEEGLRLVSTWRAQGLTMEACLVLFKNWAKNFDEKEIEKIVRDIYDKGYRYGCNDFVMSKFCDPKCIFYQNKNYIPDVKSNNDVDKLLNDWIVSMPFKQNIDLKGLFNLSHSYKIYESEMVVFLGDTKIGKSTLVQNIICNISDKKILYLPLENGIILDTRRLLQIKLGLNKDEVMNKLLEDKELFSKNFTNFYISDTTIDIKALKKLILDTNAFIVVIDTVDQIKTFNSDYTQKTQELAIALRDLTRELKIIGFLIHHISKSSAIDNSGIRKSLNIHSGKGSSALEQKADKIISIEGERDKPIRIVRSLGARDEHPFSIPCYFNKNTFQLIVENK